MLHVDEGVAHAYLDGDAVGMAPWTRVSVEDHLTACPPCRHGLEEARRVRDAASAILRTSVPDGLDRSPPRISAARRWPVLRIAATVAVLGLGWQAWSQTRMGAHETTLAIVDEAQPRPDGAEADRDAPAAASPPAPEPKQAPPPPALPRSAAGPPALNGEGPLTEEVAAAVTPPSPPPARAAMERGPELVESRTGAEVLASAAAARPPTVATGRVLDASSGRPLAAVQVDVVGSRQQAVTGRDGSFTLVISRERADTARLRVRRLGARTEEVAVPLVAGDTVLAPIHLREEVLALDSIVVTGVGGVMARSRGGTAAPAAAAPPLAWRQALDEEAERLIGSGVARLAGARRTALLIDDRGAVLTSFHFPDGREAWLVQHPSTRTIAVLPPFEGDILPRRSANLGGGQRVTVYADASSAELLRLLESIR
jgi:hypothetical protein